MKDSSRLRLELARQEDIDYIIGLENHRDNKPYLWTSSHEEHLGHIESDSFELFLIRGLEGERLGYAMVEYDHGSRVYNLRRIAIEEKRRGYGRQAMEEIFKHCFEIKNMNRLWLDVYPDHQAGVGLYEDLGMHKDGVLRENYLDQRGYLDQVVYSLLAREYWDRKKD